MIVRNETRERDVVGPGVARKILACGGGLMTVQVFFDKGAVGPVHAHPHEQASYIVSGAFELEMDGTKEIVRAGDTFYVPSAVPHGVVALEPSVIVDVFTPQRQDFLK